MKRTEPSVDRDATGRTGKLSRQEPTTADTSSGTARAGRTDDPAASSGEAMSGSSRSWTESTSAAGFTLRYLTPIRRQTIQMLGSEAEADEALKLLIGHLVASGFGKHGKGRLRDFLAMAIRSAVKARRRKQGAAENSADGESLPADCPQWLEVWREGLLERAWRSLERKEHAEPRRPWFSVLRAARQAPQESPAMLAVRLASEAGLSIEPSRLEQLLREARTAFARLLAEEVAATLHEPNREAVRQEIDALGLGANFRSR